MQVSIVFRVVDGVFYLKVSKVLNAQPTYRSSSVKRPLEHQFARVIPGIKSERAGRGNFKGVSLWLDGLT